jgi:uncharacterized protein YndB with AHSA1/START domain/DNA-binding transcriptional ArsR family regulator
MEDVFKAIADPSRRLLLDRLNQSNGQSLSELCAGLEMARQSVSKHLAVLEAAGLVTTLRRGRQKLHFLNAEPISQIVERWIDRYDVARAAALNDLKHALEEKSMGPTEFVYVTYIKTTPEQLWAALTDPAFTMRYWGAGLHSDWQVGSKVLWQSDPDGEPEDQDQVVLESDPPRRLSYSWHNYQEAHSELFGWSEDQLVELRKESRARVTFEIEPFDSAVELRVVHDGFEPGSQMLEACSGRLPQTGGWPEVIASLKSLLETGEPLRSLAAT